MFQFQVGKPYNSNVRRWEETVQYTFRGGAHELTLFFRTPSTKEVQAVQQGRTEFALVVERDVIVFLFHFEGAQVNQGGIPWSDCPYSWHLLPLSEQRVLPVAPEEMTPETRALLQVFLVDANTGLLLAMRQVSLSHEFTALLHRAILDQRARPFDKVSYDRQVRALQTGSSSQDMVRHAVVRCEGGA